MLMVQSTKVIGRKIKKTVMQFLQMIKVKFKNVFFNLINFKSQKLYKFIY